MYDDITLNKVREGNDIVDVVGEYMGENALKRAGVDWVACCPFHDEDKPSFHVNKRRQKVSCFGACGKTWDVFGIVREFEKCDFRTAVAILAKRAGIPIDDAPAVSDRPKPKPKPIKAPTLCVIPAAWVDRCRYNDSTNFWRFVSYVFGADPARRACDAYRLGGTLDGRCIFWEIDKAGQVRGGKIMQYNPTTGHRIKAADPKNDRTTWVHKIPAISATLSTGWEMSQCLFGEHLLTERPAAPVGVVESEKTAIICAIRYPQIVWVAVGGFHNFHAGRLDVLKGRNVTAYPDIHPSGEFAAGWTETANELQRLGVTIRIDTTFQKIATPDQLADKLDIGDVLIQTATAERDDRPDVIVNRWKQENPYFAALCDKLKLELINVKK